MEAQRAELALIAARNNRERIWQQLAAVVGVPSLRSAPLAGGLDGAVPELEFDSVLESLLRESPEIKIAEAGVTRAQQALKRARVEWIPNIVVRGGYRYNRELLELGGTPVGAEGFVDVGVRIPIFDRNQGNVKSARAELERARLEIERVKLSLRARLAATYRNYLDAAALVDKYRNAVIPRAQRAYDLYLNSYQQMTAAYPQVLIAQRTLFQLQVDHVEALVSVWQSIVRIRGLLLVDSVEALPMAGEVTRPFPAGSEEPCRSKRTLASPFVAISRSKNSTMRSRRASRALICFFQVREEVRFERLRIQSAERGQQVAVATDQIFSIFSFR